jgi:hypothetical protein
MLSEERRNASVVSVNRWRRNQSACKLRLSSDLHKVLLKSDAGVESACLAVYCFDCWNTTAPVRRFR